MSKVIVITGGGTGLGRALARRFAGEGESVVVMGRRLEKLQAVAAALGERALAVACDVASPDSVRAAFAKLAERHGRVDVLINNAAVFQPFLVAEATDAQLLGSIGANLTGPMFCAREAIPLIPRGGAIINVSSEVIGQQNYPFLTLYAAGKAALERFSLSLASELEPSGVRVMIVRAGKMMGAEIDLGGFDPEVGARFHKAALAAGIDLIGSPKTDYASMTGLFRSLVDLPPDVTVASVWSHGRAP